MFCQAARQDRTDPELAPMMMAPGMITYFLDIGQLQ
jgi:hypothetical protein